MTSTWWDQVEAKLHAAADELEGAARAAAHAAAEAPYLRLRKSENVVRSDREDQTVQAVCAFADHVATQAAETRHLAEGLRKK